MKDMECGGIWAGFKFQVLSFKFAGAIFPPLLIVAVIHKYWIATAQLRPAL